MAASTSTISLAHSAPFSSSLGAHSDVNAQPESNSLAPLASAAAAALCSGRSNSSKSPKNMSSRASSQPCQEEGSRSAPAAASPSTYVTQRNESPAQASKPTQNQEYDGSNSQPSSTPLSYVPEGTSKTNLLAISTPVASADNWSAIDGPGSGRPIETTPSSAAKEGTNRPFGLPPSLEDLSPRSARNISLPHACVASPKTPASGTKRHKCPYCATEFTRHHNLKSHLLTHSQEKPYECTQCQARFRRLHDLKRHIKLHTGERPHICHNCSRKFARGDALARHCKGPGGCAGRRPSFIEEDPSGLKRDESMDGIEYTTEPDHMDEDESFVARAVSGSLKLGPPRQNTYRVNTYPGVSSVHALIEPTRDASAGSQAPLSSLQQLGSQVYQQTGMTESPKPISPGQSNDRTLPPANRNMSLNSQYGSGRGTSPINLPPPAPTQLPGMQSFGPPPLPGLGSHSGSMSSSHHSGSGNSARELLGSHADVWKMVNELEKKLSDGRLERDAAIVQLRTDHERAAAEHRSQISNLNQEVERLKAQLSEYSKALHSS